MKKIIPLALVIFIGGCKKEVQRQFTPKNDSVEQQSPENPQTIKVKKQEAIRKINDDILASLKNKNYRAFSDYIHPEKGVRFSMYAFVNPVEDKHFSKADFQKYQPSKTIFTWGSRDGSGEIYKATINTYLAEWAFKKDFTKSEYSLNTFLAGGNSLNNLKEIYPDADFTENYISGSKKYGGMDWNALRFVFEEVNGRYYLIAVINDEWPV